LPRRILLVDDDIAEISAVKRVLLRAGHQPVVATNASDALASIARAPPDVVVLAPGCENGDGAALARQLAREERTQGIPLILLGEGDLDGVAAHTVPQPIDPAALEDALRAALEQAAQMPPPLPREREATAEALRARAEELRTTASAAPVPSEGESTGVPRLSGARTGEARLPSPPAGVRAPSPFHTGNGSERPSRPSATVSPALLLAGAGPRPRTPTPEPPTPAPGEEVALRAAAATWFETDVPAPDAVTAPLDASAFEEADPLRRAGGELRLVAGKLEDDRRRQHDTEVAQLALRAAAEEEAARQLRTAEEGARRKAAAKSEAEALRRLAEDEAQRRADLESERARLADAAQRARERQAAEDAARRAEMEAEALRHLAEDEAQRRADLESERARLADAAQRARERQAAEDAARRAEMEAEAGRAAVAEAARRRVLAMARERAAAASPRPKEAESTEALAPELAEGSLATVSMPRLLAMAARGRATGRLDIATDPPRSLWLEKGRIVGARSAAPGERTEEIALRLGFITREQHRQVSPAAAGLASRRVGALLLERGFLKPTELAALARRSAEEIAFALFADDALYRFEPAARVPTDERLALERGPLLLAVEGVRRRWGPPRLDAVLGSAGTLLAPAARASPVADLALSGEERRVAELADGLRTLDEIMADAPLDPVSTRQVLAALVEVGVLCIKILAPIGAPAPSPGSIDLARIDEKLDQVRRADYFVILGLGRTCTPYEIREAAERLLSELTLERFDALVADGLAAKLEEIRQVMEEARDILLDDVLRAEYLTGLGE
jgi:CheY-like chemotaxis protein